MPDNGEPADRKEGTNKGMTGRQAYNVVSDTVTGANVRVKDNVIQAVAVAVCLLIGAIIGAAAVEDRLPGALVGGFCGLVLGLFASASFSWSIVR